MASDLTYPVKDTTLVLRSCNPTEPLPAGDRRWYDFDEYGPSFVLPM